MTFDVIESSRYDAAPIDLYFFKWGSAPGSFVANTNCVNNFGFASIIYVATPIMHSPIKSTGTMNRDILLITVPRTHEIAQRFRSAPPSVGVTVIIRQGHLYDPDSEFLVGYAGRVVSVKFSGNEAVLSCESVASSLRVPGLRRHYQLTCPLALYGTGDYKCNANQATATVTPTIVDVQKTFINVSANWNPQPPEKYLGGLAEWVTPQGNIEIRTIIKVSINAIFVSGSTVGATVGQPIKISLGCNHHSDCDSLHANIQNFGGQKYIPSKNPISAASAF